MTQTSTLVLAGSGTAAPESPSAETVLLGLPLVRRTALAAARAGFDRVYVLDGRAGATSGALAGTCARLFPRDAPESSLPPGRIVLLPDRVVASPRWLRSLREAPAEAGRLYRLGVGAIVETSEPAPLARTLARASDLSSVVSGWAETLPASVSDAPVSPPLEVRADADLPKAESHLLKGLVKKEDGLLTRLISRKISLAATRRLARTGITPNAMTIVCLALGLVAAACFTSPARPWQIAGGILFLLHSILDGCDGELARLKFQESRLGGILDFWADNVVHVAVFSGFAVAWSTAVGRSWPLVLGAMAVAGTLLCAGFIYMYAMRPRSGGGPVLTSVSPSKRSRLSEVLDALARRDFIYFVMVLALFGKAYWFVAPASVGTLGFFLALVLMALNARERGVEEGAARGRVLIARILVVAAALAMLLGGAYGFIVRPAKLATTQIANVSLMRGYVESVTSYKQRHGEYPEALTAALRERPAVGPPATANGTDLWGHPVLYRRDRDGFLLVSLGRDGKPDGTDYASLRGAVKASEKPCRNPDADQVFSDRGDLRACGK